MTDGKAPETTGDSLPLSVTRHIAAPPDKVWQIMTERLAEWWCPRPWRTEIDELDWRAGGRIAAVMRGPDGEESPIEGIVLEVTPGRRFVFTDALDAAWMPRGPFMVGLFEIAPEDGGMRYTATARHWTEAARAKHEEMGFEPGWAMVADRLAELAEAP